MLPMLYDHLKLNSPGKLKLIMMTSSIELLPEEKKINAENFYSLISEIASAKLENNFHWPNLKRVLIFSLENVKTRIL